MLNGQFCIRQFGAVAALAFAMLGCVGFVGCEGARHVLTTVNPAGEGEAEGVAKPRYPAELESGEDLAIEIIRTDRRRIVIDNRTARAYENVQLWLNEQYGARLEQLPIGRSGDIALEDFTNHFGEPFPTGSLLEPEDARTLVKADLRIGDVLHPLLVRLEPDWAQR